MLPEGSAGHIRQIGGWDSQVCWGTSLTGHFRQAGRQANQFWCCRGVRLATSGGGGDNHVRCCRRAGPVTSGRLEGQTAKSGEAECSAGHIRQAGRQLGEIRWGQRVWPATSGGAGVGTAHFGVAGGQCWPHYQAGWKAGWPCLVTRPGGVAVGTYIAQGWGMGHDDATVAASPCDAAQVWIIYGVAAQGVGHMWCCNCCKLFLQHSSWWEKCMVSQPALVTRPQGGGHV